MAKLKLRKQVNINRVVVKVVATIIALYVGGTIVQELGNVMNGTASPFYPGLKIIGWTVAQVTNATSTSSCAQDDGGGNVINNCITGVGGSGILAVIGIVGIASIVTEFVEFQM